MFTPLLQTKQFEIQLLQIEADEFTTTNTFPNGQLNTHWPTLTHKSPKLNL